MTPAKTSLTPTDPNRRLEHIDVVRGFALFGVLLVNMFNFGAWSTIFDDTVDVATQVVTHFFFETKSWRLFTFLFGLGFAMQLLRAQERGGAFVPTYTLRLLVLFLFGAVNALLYSGDILMYYAELGFALMLCRSIRTPYLPGLALALLLVFPVSKALGVGFDAAQSPPEPPELQTELAQQSVAQKLVFHPYAVGDLADVVAHNARLIPPNPFTDLIGPESTPALFAMFLLGLYAGKRRILEDLTAHARLIRHVCAWGLGSGVLCMTVERILASALGYDVFDDGRIGFWPQMIGDLAFTIGSTALAVGYAAALVILWQRGAFRPLLAPLAPVGRMALSIYLLQTLMFTTLFYDYGFGQFLQLSPTGVAGFAIIFFAAQILIANWWLRRFRFGPAEWLWRSLTYRSRQPFRR